MISYCFLLGGLFLAFSFGRNNLSNAFGSAIGTGMLPMKLSAILMGLFITLGVLCGSGNVSNSLVHYLHFTSLIQVFYFSIILAFIILFLTYFGLPLSVAQLGMGALIGWALALGYHVYASDIIRLIEVWIFSPIIAGIIAYVLLKILRIFIRKFPIPLLHRDLWVRFHMIWIGCLMAFMIGANNLSIIIQPFNSINLFNDLILNILICLLVLFGCLMASRKVIHTVTSSLFPLSALEAMIMSLSGALTLSIFSQGCSFLPALPVSSGASLIGAIIGISFAKGGQGLKIKPMLWVASSWIWAPLFACLTCFDFVLIMTYWELL